MLAAGSLIHDIFCTALLIYLFVVIARVILFYIRPPIAGPMRTVYTLILDITDPVLRPIGQFLRPVQTGGLAIDLAPMVLLITIAVLRMAFC